MSEKQEPSKKNTIGYAAGQIFATVVTGCVISVLIALTVRFILWLF